MNTRHLLFPGQSHFWTLVGLALLLVSAGNQAAAAPPPASFVCGWYNTGAICSRYREWPPCSAVCGCPPGPNAAGSAATRDQASTGTIGNNFATLSSCPTCSERPTLGVQGLASYWVSEPAISLGVVKVAHEGQRFGAVRAAGMGRSGRRGGAPAHGLRSGFRSGGGAMGFHISGVRFWRSFGLLAYF